MSRITRVFGDQVSPNYRSALEGNAMLFDAQRWVRLSAGADPLPQLHSSLNYTYIFAVYFSAGTVQANILTQDDRVFNNETRGLSIWRDRMYYYTGASVATQLYQLTFNSTGLPNLRRLLIQRSFGRLNQAGEIDIQQGRSIAFTRLIRTPPPADRTIPYIDIGRQNGLNIVPNSWPFTEPLQGYMRSVEILTRHLSATEQRKVFNFGTAHAAGLITPSDISIDFNQLNGQAPICRPGSRQLTVTPYNNTTPDTAGTTYANWYSL